MRPLIAIGDPTWLIRFTPASRAAVPAPITKVLARPMPTDPCRPQIAIASWAAPANAVQLPSSSPGR